MDILRLLLVEENSQRTARISSLLTSAGYEVVPVTDLNEAAEALFVQKFDAVLLGSACFPDGLAGFCSQLRETEARQRFSSRTAILVLLPEPLTASDQATKVDLNADGYLPDDFEPAELRRMLRELSTLDGGESKSEGFDGPVFEPEQFEEQCAFERELMIEIVDLFLAERAEQLPQMCEALATGDYDHLSTIAHMIKGSLGSLHAPAAGHRAQALETAAKEQDGLRCQELLMAFDQDLEELEPHLAAFRESCMAR